MRVTKDVHDADVKLFHLLKDRQTLYRRRYTHSCMQLAAVMWGICTLR